MSKVFLYNKKLTGILISFFAHAAILICGGFAFARPIQYAVEVGSGGLEISLTAAPAEPAPVLEPVPAEAQKLAREELSKDPDDTALPQQDIEEKKPEAVKAEVKEEPKKFQTAVNSPYTGDGSSSAPGKDKTTFYSAGGAVTEAKPNYLRNPAPVYPFEARQKGWHGVVVLKVLVDKSGRPVELKKEKSSGHEILDQSALRAVKHWRFQPAQLGSLPIESSVLVPIRFELENFRK